MAFNEDLHIVEVSPTVDTAAYGAGDCVGGLLQFSSAVISQGGTAKLHSVLFLDRAAQSKGMTLILFNANPTASTFTDNAALSIHDNDLGKVIASIAVVTANYVAAGAGSLAQVVTERIIKLADSNNVLYGALMANEAIDFVAATDLTVKLPLTRFFT